MVYYAKISKEQEDLYYVEFPDLEYCVTEGTSIEHALHMATEVLSLYLKHAKNPNPPQVYDDTHHPITVDPIIATVLKIRNRRQEMGLTEEDVANKLKMRQQVYQKIESGNQELALRTVSDIATILERPLSYFVS